MRKYENKDYLGLYTMFLRFEPESAFQGIPPKTPHKIHDWLNKLLLDHRYRHYVVESDNHIVGHGVICLKDTDTAEVVLFLSREFHENLLGKELLLRILHEACKGLQVKEVWISVQHKNAPMLRLALECGFIPKPPSNASPSAYILERHVGCSRCLLNSCPIYTASFPAFDILCRAGEEKGTHEKQGEETA